MTSALIRSIVVVSVTRLPPASTYTKPFPRRRRAMPGAEQETRRRRAVATSVPSDLGLEGHRRLLGRVAAEGGADVRRDQGRLRLGGGTPGRLRRGGGAPA